MHTDFPQTIDDEAIENLDAMETATMYNKVITKDYVSTSENVKGKTKVLSKEKPKVLRPKGATITWIKAGPTS